MSFLLLLLGCYSATPLPTERPADPCAAGALPSGELLLKFTHGGPVRQALVWHPPGPGPHDIIVNLHSFRSEPRRQQGYTGWRELAAAENAILIGPDGKYATWNAGECCYKSAEKNVPDVSFLDEIVKRVEAVSCTTGRVYVTGVSNGAMMAQRWACESDVPDAVVTVGGSLQQPVCSNERPVPLLHYHGDSDTWAPIEGSDSKRSLQHAIDQWTRNNQSRGEPVRTVDGDLTCDRWTGAAPVQVCRMRDEGGAWPGAADSTLTTSSPLGDATKGGLAWARTAWAAAGAAKTLAQEPEAAETP